MLLKYVKIVYAIACKLKYINILNVSILKKGRVTPVKVISYAPKNGIHLVIIAGRIRHVKKYRIFSDLVGIGSVRRLFLK